MLQRNIKHFLKKLKYKKLGISRMNWLKKYFFLLPTVFIFYFCKNINPPLCILFLVDKSVTQIMNIEPWERHYRSSCSLIFFKIGVLKNFANFTGKHLLESLFNKVAGLKTCNFFKKRLQHRCHDKETTEAAVHRYSSK